MKHHVGFVSFIKAFVLMGPIQQEFEGRGARFKQLNRHWSQLAREIELLAPAVDRQRRPDNSEYPWFAGTSVIVPCEYGFPNLLSLTFRDVRGYKFLKLLSRAIDEYETIYRR